MGLYEEKWIMGLYEEKWVMGLYEEKWAMGLFFYFQSQPKLQAVSLCGNLPFSTLPVRLKLCFMEQC